MTIIVVTTKKTFSLGCVAENTKYACLDKTTVNTMSPSIEFPKEMVRQYNRQCSHIPSRYEFPRQYERATMPNSPNQSFPNDNMRLIMSIMPTRNTLHSRSVNVYLHFNIGSAKGVQV